MAAPGRSAAPKPGLTVTRFRTSMIMQVIFIGTALVIVVTTLAGTLASGGSTTGVVVVIVMFVVIALLVWWILRRRTLMVIAVDATTRAGYVEKPARGTDAGWRIPLSDITRAHVAMHTKWVGSGDARTQKKRHSSASRPRRGYRRGMRTLPPTRGGFPTYRIALASTSSTWVHRVATGDDAGELSPPSSPAGWRLFCTSAMNERG